MKLTKHANKNNIRSRIVSFLAVFALILCTVLSFVIIGPTRPARAEDEITEPPTKTENGIRFVQVAAGYEFAIGLTYDRKLYGWSLKASPNSGNPTSLGDVYTKTPTEIPVTFRVGPSKNQNEAWGSVNYNAVRTDDRIKSIAATGTTAAFVTDEGFLYTWGVDTPYDVSHGSSEKHYLLLRDTDDGTYSWKSPYIIDYHYYGATAGGYSQETTTVATEQLIPTSANNITSLAAGEYNYIFMFERNYPSGEGHVLGSSGDYFHTFVWGSFLYNPVHVEPASNYNYRSINVTNQNPRRIFNTFITSVSGDTHTQGVTVVAGGYTVGINNASNNANITVGGTSLQLRGRNFITTGSVTSTDENVYSVTNTAKVITSESAPALAGLSATQNNTDISVKDAIAGGRGRNNQDGSLYGIDTEQYYARQANTSSTGVMVYNVDNAGYIYGSAGTSESNLIKTYTEEYKDDKNNTQQRTISALSPVRYSVSLGNDIGYGIVTTSGVGQLYGWGDNANNQLVGLSTDSAPVGNKQEPTKLLEGVNVVSVAAGKQKSNSKAFAKETIKTINDDKDGFDESVQNDDKYISAVLTDDGDIYAWTKGVNTAQQLTFKDISGDKKEKFAAVYSGYGENLFAVTERGKLVRITVVEKEGVKTFNQYFYDEFCDQNKSTVKNWEVNSSNTVSFKVPAVADNASVEEKIAPKLGNATFYVWAANAKTTDKENAVIDADNVLINPTVGSNREEVSTTYRTLVSINNIGDAYRIIGFDANDVNINYLNADNLSDNKDAQNYYAPKFFFDNNVMSDVQRDNMFTYKPVCDDSGAAVGIYIEPKQSTKGKIITIRFYVARYNNYDKYAATMGDTPDDNSSVDNAIYYDYKQCEIKFSVADTSSVITYSQYNSANGGKSNIPLLDPNNDYNKYYSLAVQDVSTGIDELIKFLTGHLEDNEVNADFKKDILDIVKSDKGDKGFPDKDKISKGNLDYYLSAVDQGKYNDVYQYVFADRDSDRIKAYKRGVGGTDAIINSGVGVSAEIETITVKVELKSDYELASGFDGLSAAAFVKKISTEFDNKYGLYDFAYTTATEDEQTKNYLTFKYDVVTFEATASTGTLIYTGDKSSDTRITNYNTVQGQPRAGASFYADTVNNYNYTAQAGYTENTAISYPRTNAQNVAYVYSQPSLRLSNDYMIELVDNNGEKVKYNVIGQATGGRNEYTVDINSEVFVGETKEIKFSSYIKQFVAGIMSFAYKNEASTTALENFSKQFDDDTGHGMSVVTLHGDSIIVHPTTAAPISFTVEMQRFADSGKSRYFTDANGNADEKIYITFNYNNIVGFNMTKNSAATPTKGYLITKTTTVDVFNGVDNGTGGKTPFINLSRAVGIGNISATARAELEANAQIYMLSSSEDTNESTPVFTINRVPNDKTRFTIVPKRSGSGIVMFSVNIFDKTESFIIPIHVSAQTTLSNTISIKNNEYVTVSELKEALRDANSFNEDVMNDRYKILYNDVSNPDAKDNDKLYEAIYFTDSEGTVIANNALPFISNVVFDNIDSEDPTMRIIASNSTTEHSKPYNMHVKFINADKSNNATKYADAPEGSIIEIIIPVMSGKVKLQGENGNLLADIDCRHIDNNKNWWKTQGSKLDTKVTIELSYLLNLDQTATPDNYRIFLLSAESEAASYFQYGISSDEKSIIITPKDNTENKRYELNVSVYMVGSSTTKVLTFEVAVKGILTKLPVMTDEDGIIGYGNIWLYSFAIVFGVLFIIFLIRFIVYTRKRAKQRAIIKRNQDLIRMRDRMHGKATSATREQLVKSKLKMEDPKYAKMFNEMRKDKEEETGVTLENSDLAATAERKTNKKKKKGGKKSVAELKAELEAKKAAFAAAQSQNAQPVNPFVNDMPMDGDAFGAPDGGFGAPDGGYAPDGNFGAQSIDGNEIIFDASDIGDGNM